MFAVGLFLHFPQLAKPAIVGAIAPLDPVFPDRREPTSGKKNQAKHQDTKAPS